MGKGGYVVLINGTNYTWIKTHSYTYQMNAWNFDDRIQPAKVHICYVEWNQEIFKHWSDDEGKCTYQLEGTNFEFQVRGINKNFFEIYIDYKHLSNLGSNSINLGFNHDGHVIFILSGRDEKFISSQSNASNWMAENLDIIGNRILNDLSIPGSHDSGMSEISSTTFFANENNTKTQALNIFDQLKLGIRYFDIRPVIGNGNFYVGHYSKVMNGWQGASGQSLDSIIEQINKFTSNRIELIIINLSHGLNTDLGNSNYRSLNQAEYERCFQKLKSINNLFVSCDAFVNLLEKPVNHFLGNEKSAVCLILNEDNIDLGSLYHHGFYKKDEFKMVDSYADSDDLAKMIDDQMTKLAHFKGDNNNYFLISWFLTQGVSEVVIGPSIEELAHKANSSLYRLILDSDFRTLIRKGFPNVISQDFVSNTVSTAICLAINFFKDTAFHVKFRN